jgi:ketosteroid isomerase-like protein
MKSIFRGILILMCLTLLSSSQLYGQEWSEEQKEVWAVVEDLWQAWADGDYNKIIGFVADDFRGWNESFHAPYEKKESQPWNERRLKKNNFILHHLHPFAIDIHDDIAIVFYSYQEIVEQKDGSDKEEQGKWMDIYKKIDGKWLLIAEAGFDFSSLTN